jgi:hypothetical protein
MLKQLAELSAKETAGQADVGIFASEKTPGDIIAAQHRLVRVYRVDREAMNKMIRNTARPLVEAVAESNTLQNREVQTLAVQGGATARQKEAAEAGRVGRATYMSRLAHVVKSAQMVAPEWYSVADVATVLEASGMSKQDALMVAFESTGDIKPGDAIYVPRPTIKPYQTRAWEFMRGVQ